MDVLRDRNREGKREGGKERQREGGVERGREREKGGRGGAGCVAYYVGYGRAYDAVY